VLDFLRVEEAQLHAGVLDHRILCAELAERVYLLTPDHGRPLRALGCHHNFDIFLWAQSCHGNQSFCEQHSAPPIEMTPIVFPLRSLIF
jgi:hypothetical protein